MRIGIGIGIPALIRSAGVSLLSLLGSQSFGLEIVASKLLPLLASQSFTVDIVATESTLTAAQVRGQIAQAVITLGTTMRASGTTPPVVLLAAGSQSLTFGAGLCAGFYVDILPGALTFDLSFNSGSTMSFTAQTIPVGGGNYTIPSGTYAGMIITFPLGTYNADNVYEGTCATFRSTEGNSYTFTQATAAAQPVFRHAAVTADGKAALFFNGAQWIASTDAAVCALFTNDPARTVHARIQYTVADPAVAGNWLTACSSASNTVTQIRFTHATTGLGREQATYINDAGTSQTDTCNTDPLLGGANAHNVGWITPGSNGGISLRSNDTSQVLGASTWNVGTITPTRVGFGAKVDQTPDAFEPFYLYDFAFHNSVLSGADFTAWHTALLNGT